MKKPLSCRLAVGSIAWLGVLKILKSTESSRRQDFNGFSCQLRRLFKLLYLRARVLKIMAKMLILRMKATYLSFKCRVVGRRLAGQRQELRDHLAEYCQVIKDHRLVIGVPHDLVDQLDDVVAFGVHTSNENKMSDGHRERALLGAQTY